MNHKKHIIFAISSLLIFYGCSHSKYSPQINLVDDKELISALKKMTIKLESTANNDMYDPSYYGFIYQITNAQLFREVKKTDEYADLIITDYINSQFDDRCSFFNEAIAYMTFFGYGAICNGKYVYNFKLKCAKEQISLSFGPLSYEKKTLAGWFFAPIGLSKQWHSDFNSPRSDTNPALRNLWITILSTKKHEILHMVERIQKRK